MTKIAIFADGIEPFHTEVTKQRLLDGEFDALIQDIAEKLVCGEMFEGSTFSVVSLEHPDGPILAGPNLDLDQMDTLLALFCKAHGLPFKSADELLAEVSNHDLISTGIVNWLSCFADAYLDHHQYDQPARIKLNPWGHGGQTV